MTIKTLLASCALAAALSLPAFAQAEGNTYQTDSLFGERLYADVSAAGNLASEETFERVTAEARADFEENITPDTATWYGRVLSYQGYYREAIDIYQQGLREYPNNAKLRRHLAHRYFTLRRFEDSIEEGLRAVELYDGQPLEREKLGPDYFQSTPDVVQFYLYYHLGQAYFATGDYENAARWFVEARDVSRWTRDAPGVAAGTYWGFLALGRAGRFEDALELLDEFDMTLPELSANIESNFYFDGIQLFKGHREPGSFFSTEGTGMAFSDSSSITSSTAFTLANYYLLDGQREEAKEWYRRAINVDGWSYFARIQAEADWQALFPGETP
ncbi:tetratricopeptide repeat protein [Marinicauda sp. Alg238-R41]|uniref:tetratricopeptide repeat protein n=1 Tax=Marinicauda sp. Alg238-R41 TaxID=2993447 RepID=UPI0022E028D6|nr:tetratricopeptide repeat protein [Marinicauda sp. Alg238-R41]